MDADDYQSLTLRTAIYPDPNTIHGLNYTILAMCGEAGEVANRFKKVLRDDKGRLSPWARDDLIEELGDVMWYLARIASELDVSLSHVMNRNLAKLNARHHK